MDLAFIRASILLGVKQSPARAHLFTPILGFLRLNNYSMLFIALKVRDFGNYSLGQFRRDGLELSLDIVPFKF